MQIKFNEKGRSMVEMLGVLAIIGVLSVGGIMGYKYGMMKYRVNETINELNIMANTYGVQMQQMAEKQTLPSEGELLSEENAVTRMGYGYEVLGFDNHFEIALFDVPNPECEQLQKTGWELPYDIQVAEVTVEKCDTLVYYIDNGLTGTLTEYVDSDEEDAEEDDDNNPCNKAGTESWDGSICHCKKGYLGGQCEQCDTVGGFVYQDSVNKCYSRYNTCTHEIMCNGHGYANPVWGASYLCACFCDDGYYGTHCENYAGDNVCSGHGTWSNDHYSGSGNGCSCKDGYYGLNCELTDKEKECSGHGTIMGYGHCFCEEGWSGENCEKEGTHISPCVNGIETTINGVSFCICNIGWAGETCEEAVCNGKGTLEGDKCVCIDDYTSESNCTEHACNGQGRLENGKCKCYSSNLDPLLNCLPYSVECNGAGSLINGRCVCKDPVQYDASQNCKHVCNGKGTVNENGKCVCISSSYDPATNCLPACDGNGDLTSDGKCKCDNFSYLSNGTCIEMTFQSACNNRGMVVNGKCICHKFYTSESNCSVRACNGNGILDDNEKCNCNSDYDPSTNCKTRLCNAHGVLNSNGTCSCNAGYEGSNCEIEVCGGGGRKLDNGECSCTSGYMQYNGTCVKKSATCNNYGILVDGKCKCDSNYRDPDTNCKESACSGHGYLDTDGKCICYNYTFGSYIGDKCEINCSTKITCPQGAIIGVLKGECTCLYRGGTY